MRVPLRWLREYCRPGLDAAALADRLDMTGTKVERVVRHEVAHVLIDPLLEGRPLWVREGVAAYFAAGANLEGGLQTALQCPSDAELRRPASPEAQRDAYARAAACVRRQIAAGTSGRDVR